MAEEMQSPIIAGKPPMKNPLATSTAAHASTLKLKPVIRKPGAGVQPTALKITPIAPAAEKPAANDKEPEAVRNSMQAPMEQLKGMTQKLKGVTQEIPQQAILRKTGIIAGQNLADSQKQASKSRTMRISLSEALGVAPVNEKVAVTAKPVAAPVAAAAPASSSPMPMKTIRIKRPTELSKPSVVTPPAAAPVDAAPAEVAAPADAVSEEVPAAAAAESAPKPTLTQRKTLKISRPGKTAAHSGPKFGVKKPGAELSSEAAASNAEGALEELEPIADIPDLGEVKDETSAKKEQSDDVPAFVAALGLIVQIAACCAMGFLAWNLYSNVASSLF